MLKALITVRQETLFSLLQKAQTIESLGTITETHESFFRRKYSTADVGGIIKCGCFVGRPPNRVIPPGTSGRQNIRHLSLGSGRQQNPAPVSTILTVGEEMCCSLIHKNHSSSAQQVLKIQNK
jgi:hypothetical protein